MNTGELNKVETAGWVWSIGGAGVGETRTWKVLTVIGWISIFRLPMVLRLCSSQLELARMVVVGVKRLVG